MLCLQQNLGTTSCNQNLPLTEAQSLWQKNNNNSRWLAGEAQDILHTLREKHFLMECLDSAISDIYFEASDETRESLAKVQTLLRAYDHEKAVKQLSAAIRLLDEARKAGKE